MQNIIEKFNSFFSEIAKAEIKGDCLEVTIDTQTLIIHLPSVVGTQSESTD